MFALASVMLLAPGTAILQTPDIFGDRVVFTAEGDLWLGSIYTGVATRLTSAPGREFNAKFSPDGKAIAFSAQYDSGTTNVYTIPTDGGEPKRLTWESGTATVQDWSPDGKTILYRSPRGVTKGFGFKLYSVPANGGLVKNVPVPEGQFGSYLPDGQLAYVPSSREWMNWFRYEGGAADAVWLTDLKGGFKKLTSSSFTDTTPVWGGDAIYYVSEKSGTPNLWRIDPRTNQQTMVTRNVENEIRYPGSDGKRVIFEAGPTLATYDPTTKISQPLSFQLVGDRIHARPQLVAIAPSMSNPVPGPTGKRVALIARGQVVSVAVENGENRVLDGTPGARASLAAWSKDGKTIAYISDRTGENEIWTVAAEGGSPRQLTKGIKGNFISLRWAPDGKSLAAQDREGRTLLVDSNSGIVTVAYEADFIGSYDSGSAWVAFSPDSRFLAFIANRASGYPQVVVYDSEKKSATSVSPEGMSCYMPAFSPDGKYLAYIAERRIEPAVLNMTQRLSVSQTTAITVLGVDPKAPSPFAPKLDDEGKEVPDATKKPAVSPNAATLEGIQERAFDAPIPVGEYSQLYWVDGQMLLVKADKSGLIAGSPSRALVSFDLETKKLKELAGDVTGLEISADGTKALVTSGGLSLVDLTSGEAKPIVVSGYVKTQPDKEWRQILRESWRIARDFFYDPGMHGVDWNAVLKKYEARLPSVGDRSDLVRLQKAMLSELNTGHCYIDDPSPRRAPFSMGYLGADYEAAPDGVKIVRILRADAFTPGGGSPLSAPDAAVAVGDVITAIDGEPIAADREIQSYLEGKGGKFVVLNLKHGSEQRKVVVKTLDSETTLRYQDWVEGRRQYVAKVAGPNFGYMHIPDMVENGATSFLKSQLANVMKDAVVIDFRGNGGGFISSLLIENFAAKRFASWHVRAGGPWNREGWAFRGHLAAMCDEDNFSDGELVIEAWKNLKIGPVIGKRTGGGEVGSGNGYSLIDGGAIFVPNYGAFANGKWIIEGYGATPTIEVDQDPAAVMAGKDPQMDRAIAELQAWLKREPLPEVKVPPFPVKLKGSHGG